MSNRRLDPFRGRSDGALKRISLAVENAVTLLSHAEAIGGSSVGGDPLFIRDLENFADEIEALNVDLRHKLVRRVELTIPAEDIARSLLEMSKN